MMWEPALPEAEEEDLDDMVAGEGVEVHPQMPVAVAEEVAHLSLPAQALPQPQEVVAVAQSVEVQGTMVMGISQRRVRVRVETEV
jgi:hypothetical protein